MVDRPGRQRPEEPVDDGDRRRKDEIVQDRAADQIAAADALLALKVNGQDLSLDHGFPARIIVPALPGVHNTKWVGQMTFRSA